MYHSHFCTCEKVSRCQQGCSMRTRPRSLSPSLPAHTSSLSPHSIPSLPSTLDHSHHHHPYQAFFPAAPCLGPHAALLLSALPTNSPNQPPSHFRIVASQIQSRLISARVLSECYCGRRDVIVSLCSMSCWILLRRQRFTCLHTDCNTVYDCIINTIT
jgi:hypothetical protein